MSYYRPESMNSAMIAFTQLASIAGTAAGVGLILTGVATPAGLALSTLGPGLLTSTISLASFSCANAADRAHKHNQQQLDIIHRAEKGESIQDVKLTAMDPTREPNFIVTGIARYGGMAFALTGALCAVTGALPLIAGAGLALAGATAFQSARVADDARSHAEQYMRRATRHIRQHTPATEWAQHAQPMMGVRPEPTTEKVAIGKHTGDYLSEKNDATRSRGA